METGAHFRKLYDIVKDEGIGSALKYDFNITKERHPKAAVGLATFGSLLTLVTSVFGGNGGNIVNNDYPEYNPEKAKKIEATRKRLEHHNELVTKNLDKAATFTKIPYHIFNLFDRDCPPEEKRELPKYIFSAGPNFVSGARGAVNGITQIPIRVGLYGITESEALDKGVENLFSVLPGGELNQKYHSLILTDRAGIGKLIEEEGAKGLSAVILGVAEDIYLIGTVLNSIDQANRVKVKDNDTVTPVLPDGPVPDPDPGVGG